MKRRSGFISSLAVLVILICTLSPIFASPANPDESVPKTTLSTIIEESLTNGEHVCLDLYVMSLCPYAMEAEKAIIPIVKAHPDQIELNIYYIADETGTGGFVSMHGQEEVEEDMRQMIIKQLYPDHYYDYLLVRAQTSYENNWRNIAQKLGINPRDIEFELLNTEPIYDFSNNINTAKHFGIDVSPSLINVTNPLSIASIDWIDPEMHKLEQDTIKKAAAAKGATCKEGDKPYCTPIPKPNQGKTYCEGDDLFMDYIGIWTRCVKNSVTQEWEWIRDPFTSRCEKISMGCCPGKEKRENTYIETRCIGGKMHQDYQHYKLFICKLKNGKGEWEEQKGDYSEKVGPPSHLPKCKKCVQRDNQSITVIDDDEDPGICLKCKDGNVVPDDSEDPGLCLKCSGGVAVPDDSEDPGMCKKCLNGVVVSDDSQFIGNCKQCKNGEPENWDNPNLTRCKKCLNGEEVSVDGPDPQCGPGEICCGGFCTNIQTDPVNCGACGNICASGEECCYGACRKPIYEYTVTTTETTCGGSNTEDPSETNVTTDPGSVKPGCVSTGQLTYSYGVCTGGSVRTVCTTAPVRKPCQ